MGKLEQGIALFLGITGATLGAEQYIANAGGPSYRTYLPVVAQRAVGSSATPDNNLILWTDYVDCNPAPAAEQTRPGQIYMKCYYTPTGEFVNSYFILISTPETTGTVTPSTTPTPLESVTATATRAATLTASATGTATRTPTSTPQATVLAGTATAFPSATRSNGSPVPTYGAPNVPGLTTPTPVH